MDKQIIVITNNKDILLTVKLKCMRRNVSLRHMYWIMCGYHQKEYEQSGCDAIGLMLTRGSFCRSV